MNVPQEFSFSYVFGTPQKTNAIFQRVPIRKLSVYNTAFMMEWIKKEAEMERIRCASLVDTSSATVEQAKIDQSIATLGVFTTVIDVADQDAAKRQMEDVFEGVIA